jgi:hypothetical protein
VHKDSTTWVLDVGVVCPGPRRHVSAGADTTPGVATEEYAATKSASYADQHNFLPFIVESAGRVNRAGIQFLDLLRWASPQWHLSDLWPRPTCPPTRCVQKRSHPVRPPIAHT